MAPARATSRSYAASSALEIPSDVSPNGAERRTEPRFTPTELQNRLVARHKYGEAVTLIDLSAGGVQFETPRLVRPDLDVVLEIINSRTSEISQVVSRVLRANVAAINGGIRYRAACAFRRPLSNASLLAPSTVAAATAAPAKPAISPEYLKLEVELKTIVEGYFNRQSGNASGGRDARSLFEALVRIRSAAERRRDPFDRQLGALLSTIVPALQRREPTDAVVRKLHGQLAEDLPLIAIRPGNGSPALVQDCESITLNMSVDPACAPLPITAEFPAGFGLDASQFRLLKLSAYLVGLIESWNRPASNTAPAGAAQVPTQTDADGDSDADALPLGWHRVVLRYLDGQLLRGYASDFNPERAFLQFSPNVSAVANERMLVPLARLKAVFFVKNLKGDANRVDLQTFDEEPRGRKVQVTFRDGEVMTGSTLSYKPNGQGFFVVPANLRGNNVRVYVVNAAVRHIRFV